MSALFHSYLCGRNAAEWLINMLCCMAVDPDYRRRHIATAMFEQMLTIADRARDITVSTFRAEDPKGDAPRAFYKRHGFVEGELCMEYMCPSQMFILHPEIEKAGNAQ